MSSYPLYPTRRTLSLDGSWDFAWLGDADWASLCPATLNYADRAAVPGVFDTDLRRCGGRGVGVYRRRVAVGAAAGTLLRLRIGALGLRGRVWWNGVPVGDTALAYSPLSCELTADGAPFAELAIAVDNRFDAQRSPLFPPYSDFYAYGGIYRGITLSVLPAAVRVERAIVTTVSLSPPRLRVRVELAGAIPAGELSLAVAFDEAPATTLPCRPCGGVVEFEQELPGAAPWTPEHPELHTITVGVAGDAVSERFGLRMVAARDGALWLNGERLRLRGVNRHEAHPQFGPVQPLALLLDDLHAIKALGCNFIRAVHYPQAPEFLDLCDELGLLVWEESLSWGLPEQVLLQAETQRQVTAQTGAMVREGRNHPAILIWGFLNECASNSERAEPLYVQLAELIRSEDPTRLVAYASNRFDGDRCFRHVDVVACNPYPGWIWPQDWQTPSAAMIAPFLAKAAALADVPELCGKPLLVSEIGACALYGCHDRAKAQWSEEYQAEYMAEACRVILADPRWSGIVLWQFCDTRSFVGVGDVRSKPRGFNNAGLVDEYRRPKLAYDAVQALFTAVAPGRP